MIYSFCIVFTPRAHSPAVSPSKPRDFRFHEPTILFSPTGQRFPLPNHVTSGCMSPRSYFPYWSVVSPSKSRDFRFQALPAHDVIDLLSTNQKPPYAPYGRSLLLTRANKRRARPSVEATNPQPYSF